MKRSSELNDDERNWLSQESLSAYVLVNLALGFPPLERPIKDSVRLPKWRALREAIRKGQIEGATNPPGEGPNLYSMIPLSGLLPFLARPRLGTSWQWLRDFVAVWCAVHSELYGEDPTARPKSAVSSQANRDRCQSWLEGLMGADPEPGQTKAKFRDEARSRFGISGRAFDRLWSNAVETNPKWSASGRRKGKFGC